MRSGRRVWAGEHPQNRAKQVTTDSALAKVAKDYRLGAIDSVEPVRDAGHVPIDAPVRNVCEPYQKAVELGLRRGRNTRGIWQDLVSDCSFSTSYVQRFVRQVPATAPAAKPRFVSNPRGRPHEADTASNFPAAVTSRSGRNPHRYALRRYPSPARPDGRVRILSVRSLIKKCGAAAVDELPLLIID
jgi:hypothetical protein